VAESEYAVEAERSRPTVSASAEIASALFWPPAKKAMRPV
jgi:hypothetical protein